MRVLHILPLFALCACVSPNQQNLDGAWKIENLRGFNAEMDSAPTMNFAGAKVFGNSGCNSYSGGFNMAAQSLKFTPLAQTKMACIDGNRMEIESAFGQMIEKVARFNIKNGELYLLDQNGGELARLAKTN